MRWRNPFRRRTEKRNLSLDWDTGDAPAPSTVDVRRALRLAPVFAAGRLLASNVAMLPLKTYRRSGDDRTQIKTPALFSEPAAHDNLHTWLFRAMTSLAYRGNAVGLITGRDFYDFPTSIEWLDLDQVQVMDSNEYGPGSYTQPIWYYRGRVVDSSDIVHIPWFPVPGKVLGLSPISSFAATVTTGLGAHEYQADWFTNGGVPPGTFQNADKEISQPEAVVLKKRFKSAMRTHEPLVFGKGWEYKPISISDHDARFIEVMKLGATEIASIYGIPPEKLGGERGSSMTYANSEQEAIDFVQQTLMPWLTALEAALTNLLPRGQYVKFNVDALVRPDSETRFANYARARQIGLMNIDEQRAMEDMPPLPDGEGQDYTPLAILARNQSASPAEPDAPTLSVAGERASKLQVGEGSHLWKYWTTGKGLARWIGATHKWTTLHEQLLSEGVPAHEADGLTTNIIEAVLPGYMKAAHHHRSA